MRPICIACLAVLLSGCGFFKDPKEPSEAVLHSATRASDFPPNAAAMTADQWLQQSLAWHKQSRYFEAIAAAQTALFLRPDFAEAYNNIGVGYSELHMWDLAIQAEMQAVRLKPDFTLAKNNIAWAQSQKQRGVR